MKNIVKWCPLCDQGWVCIVKDKKTHQLFLCCDECETVWENPVDISEESCMSFNSHEQYEYPTDEDIEKEEWNNFIIKQVDATS
jgi:hypothetical protein